MVVPYTRMVLRFRFSWSLLVGAGTALVSAGCGNTIYAFQANSASNKVEEAHELGAEKLAPYEYYYAKEHLEKAQEEAAEADYSDAINLAEESEEYADKAIRLTKEAHRGAGR
jgi:hypothetical protein